MNKFKLRAGNRCQLTHIRKQETDNRKPITENRKPTTVNPRRYFYPSLEDLPYINSENCPTARDLAKRVLCLPLYVDLTSQNLALIVQQVNL